MNLALAVMGHKDVGPAIEEITALPLEKRYTWRVASALKWALADFENLNVVADRRTLSQEDLDKLVDLLRVRPLQFCLFLAALFGEEQMERLMTCLKNGLAKRRSRCAPLPRTVGTGVFWAASGSRGEKSGFNCPPRGGSGVCSNRPGSQNGDPCAGIKPTGTKQRMQ
jgi:hypothetical protein